MDDETGSEHSRWRDVWQLHIPLVLVLTLCTVLTVVEARRATEGVWRAWWYMFEWPIFGLFAIWIWHRYRTEGSVTRGVVQRWRDRVEEYQEEADRADRSAPPQQPERGSAHADPELKAWQAYVEDLQRREPPGGQA